MKKVLLFTAVLGLAFASCKKEGCTDSNASNFDAEAKDNDGSCTYDTTAIVVNDSTTTNTTDTTNTTTTDTTTNSGGGTTNPSGLHVTATVDGKAWKGDSTSTTYMYTKNNTYGSYTVKQIVAGNGDRITININGYNGVGDYNTANGAVGQWLTVTPLATWTSGNTVDSTYANVKITFDDGVKLKGTFSYKCSVWDSVKGGYFEWIEVKDGSFEVNYK